MKKMKSTLLSLLIAGSVINPVYATAMDSEDSSGNDVGQEKFRVYVEANKKSEKSTLKTQYSARWELTENGFSTDMNEKQFEALQKNKNFTVTKVPIVTLDTIGLEDDSMVENETLDLVTSLRASQQIPWGIKAIYNNDTLTSTTGGSGINIAVLDTGVNTSHPDLVNNVEQCKDFTGATTPINNSCTDRNGHGTHVAGTALADGGSDQAGIYGVAPDADLWAYKV
ncbi:MAG: S8 family serine peptidase, partial [Lysinibacillus fusiformis]|nr:S8 family serine peptidase [Lysinibacillus fusiformis]